MKIDCGQTIYDNYVTSSFDIAYSLSKALDLVNPLINDHHQRVAFIAGSIAEEAGKSRKEIEDVILASLVHDIGVIIEKEFHELVKEEDSYENEFCHVLVGSYLLKNLKLFPGLSLIVKYHHSPYAAKTNPLSDTDEIPELSYILHLADRLDVLLNRNLPALEQRDYVLQRMSISAAQKFKPEHYEAFLRLAEREHFWFDIEEQEKYQLIKYNFHFSHIHMDIDGILETSRLLSRIIDFRCVFTSTHSTGVAAVASELARLYGMDEDNCKAAMIAGYLHDIGKLAIPSEILYKEGALSEEETRVLRKHPYYTYRILKYFQIFDTIKEWAAFHHENLKGSGYPFHLKGEKLCTGSRIVAAADIFTALTEERPYRSAEPKDKLITMFKTMSENGELDPAVAALLIKNFDVINLIRENAQESAAKEFAEFSDTIFRNKICAQNKNFISVLKP